MITFHLYAVGMTLGAYLLLAVSYYGWGRMVSRIMLPSRPSGVREHVCPYIWLGWCWVLFLLQVLHLFLPVRWFVTVPVFVVGIMMGVAPLWKWLIALDKKRLMILGCAGIPLLCFSAWLASRAMLPVDNYDSGLYHLGTIRWINTYRLVPGLGNLHGRLAFNHSFFVYVASLNIYPVFMHGRSLANSFLILAALGLCLEYLQRSFHRGWRLLALGGTVPVVFSSMAILCFLGLISNGVRSPSPDLASAILQVVIFTLYGCFLLKHIQSRGIDEFDVLLVVFLSVTAVTVKFSNLVFCGTIVAIVGAIYLVNVRRVDRFIWILAGVCCSVVLVYALRGVILSGFPFYPLAFGRVPVEWALSRDKAILEAQWIYSWARAPYADLAEVLGSTAWFHPWLQRILQLRTMLVYPAILFLGCSICSLIIVLVSKPKSRGCSWLYGLFIVPLVAGLAFWFFSAPDPRFAKGLFLLLPVVGGTILSQSVLGLRLPLRIKLACVLGIMFITSAHMAIWVIQHRWTVQVFSRRGWHSSPVVAYEKRVTNSGLDIYLPVGDDRAWDGPLPGTPYFNDHLSLRIGEDIGSGFIIKCDDADKKLQD